MTNLAHSDSSREYLPAAKSQRARILDLLVSAHGGEVPSVELSKISLQYCARVKELRDLGFQVLNRTERVDGQVHGFFRIELGFAPKREPVAIPAKKQRAVDPPAPNRTPATDFQDSLFGDIARVKDRTYLE